MKLNGIWATTADGQKTLDPACGRTDDAALKARLLTYMESGRFVMAAMMMLRDRIDPSRPGRVPVSYYTDGEWVWGGEDIYYLREHGILPRPEFVAWIEEHGPKAPEVSEDRGREVADWLTGGRLGRS